MVPNVLFTQSYAGQLVHARPSEHALKMILKGHPLFSAATPPDYSVFRHSDEDRRCFINCYLQEKLKVQGTPMSADQDEYKAKFKELYTHVCKCELVSMKKASLSYTKNAFPFVVHLHAKSDWLNANNNITQANVLRFHCSDFLFVNFQQAQTLMQFSSLPCFSFGTDAWNEFKRKREKDV